MTGRIFVNYRRGASQAAAGRLRDRLVQHFRSQDVFMDVDGIEPGVDFTRALDEQVAKCDAFIAVIGPGWAQAKGADGSRRLDNPRDYVRVEIESALNRDIRVIPVLVDGAHMPAAADLPASLQPLAHRNAVEIAHHRFTSDADGLARAIQRALGIEPTPAAEGSSGLEKPKESWADFLFSFKGRVSRKAYWWAGLAITAIVMVFAGALFAVLVPTLGPGAMETRTGKIIYLIVVLPFYWPVMALQMKRLHDIGQGWALFSVVLALIVGQVAFDLAGDQQTATTLLLVGLGVGIVIGCIKGVPGPNQYGPDPLAKPDRPNLVQKAA